MSHRSRSLFGLALSGLLAITAHAAAAPATFAAFPGRSGKIVFVGQFPGLDSELVSVDADGSKRRRLTFDGLEKFAPAWSPDGRKIAYAASSGETTTDIFVIDADGTNKRRLTRGAMAYTAEWSADGSRLLLTVQRSERRFDIDVIRADGRERRPLFRTRMDRRGAVWSPDGGTIAYQSARRGRAIYTASSDGSGERKLITGGLGGWLPNGSSLAVIRRDLFRVSLRGRVERLLLRHPPGGFSEIALSPDARKVAYTAAVQVGNSDEIHLFTADLPTSSSSEISGGNASEMPDWQGLCTLYGTERADILRGTPGPDKICALGGNDVIRASAGDDIILGGPGNDCLNGGDGDDWLFGGAGNDTILAGSHGNDVADGGPDRDQASVDRIDTRRDIETIQPRGARSLAARQAPDAWLTAPEQVVSNIADGLQCGAG